MSAKSEEQFRREREARGAAQNIGPPSEWGDYDPDQDERICIAHENPEIHHPDGRPTMVRRMALEGPGGLGERGWYEIDPAEAKEAELKGLLKDELADQAAAAGIDTTGMTKDDIKAALVNAAENV